MPELTAGELAERVGGELRGDPGRPVSGVAPLEHATPTDLTFAQNAAYLKRTAGRSLGAVLTSAELGTTDADTAWIVVDDPQLALADLLALFHPPEREPGIAATARIGPGAVLGRGVAIGPHAVIGPGATLGDRTVVGPGTLIGPRVEIGADCRIGHTCTVLAGARLGDRVILHPGVRVATDGFGYAATEQGARKIPQVGLCVLEEDVEVGANSTIDRGALGETRVGARTRIDNLVHIAHNVLIGEDCMIVAQVGIAGSVRIGRGTQLGGQAGIAGHLNIGAGARIGAQAGVIGDVPAGAEYSGYPARPHGAAMRASASLFKLPGALRRLARLERRLGVDETPEEPPETA